MASCEIQLFHSLTGIWLALLLIRCAETKTGHTWRQMREQLQRMHLGEFHTDEGKFLQRTELTHYLMAKQNPRIR